MNNQRLIKMIREQMMVTDKEILMLEIMNEQPALVEFYGGEENFKREYNKIYEKQVKKE